MNLDLSDFLLCTSRWRETPRPAFLTYHKGQTPKLMGHEVGLAPSQFGVSPTGSLTKGPCVNLMYVFGGIANVRKKKQKICQPCQIHPFPSKSPFFCPNPVNEQSEF
jgi:hypothetical protein